MVSTGEGVARNFVYAFRFRTFTMFMHRAILCDIEEYIFLNAFKFWHCSVHLLLSILMYFQKLGKR